MERKFVSKIKELRECILEMGGLVERALEELRGAISAGESELLHKAMSYERKIDAAHIQIDNLCLQMLAKQAPVASDLRLILALVKINSDLERVGDQVINISYNFREYLEESERLDTHDIINMDQIVQQMLRNSLNALATQDVALAQSVLQVDDAVDEQKTLICDGLVEKIKAIPTLTNQAIDLMLIARNIERIGDHATNIAENVIFAHTGKDIRHGSGEENPVE